MRAGHFYLSYDDNVAIYHGAVFNDNAASMYSLGGQITQCSLSLLIHVIDRYARANTSHSTSKQPAGKSSFADTRVLYFRAETDAADLNDSDHYCYGCRRYVGARVHRRILLAQKEQTTGGLNGQDSA